jgi:hypothetical protein
MAYHYAIHTGSGEKRRILTSSLPTYENSGSWVVFDTEEERETFSGPDWYAINYATRYSPAKMTAITARAYWTEQKLRQGWALFPTYEQAANALHDMRPVYSFNPETGKVWRIQSWLPPELREEKVGFSGEYAGEFEAQAANPAPFHYISKNDGSAGRCYPAQRGDLIRNGYVVANSLEECRALLPVRYSFSATHGKYRRVYTGRLMGQPSMLARLRGACRAIKRGESSYFEVNRFDYDARAVLQEIYNSFIRNAQGANPIALPQSRRVELLSEFVTRLAPIAGGNLFICRECNEGFCSPLFSSVHDGELHCSACNNRFTECHECGVAMRIEGANTDGRGRSYCEAHWLTSREPANGIMLEYSADVTRSRPCFLMAPSEHKSSRTLWLGWELEVHARGHDGHGDTCCDECEDSEDGCQNEDCGCHDRGTFQQAVQRVQETAGGWAIVKSDGSLDNGMEIVSVPASLAWHTQTVKPWLEGAKSYLSGWPHNDCGIHVHVGRKQLTELTQGKLLTFMHDEANQPFITHVAGRDTNTYCLRGGSKKKIPYYRREEQHGRYQALNFATRGQKTVEFRIFRSNVSPAGFMKNLEFVHGLCTWARLTSMQDVCNKQAGIRNARATKAAENFAQWIARERSQYPHLVRWFEGNGYLPKPRIHPDIVMPVTSIAA